MRWVLLLSAAALCVCCVSGQIYDGYSQQTATNLCTLGPNTFCQSLSEEDICQLGNTTVGVCGYSSNKCPLQTIPQFCSNTTTLAPNKTQFAYNGGLTGMPPGLFGYYVLELYWPPSNCNATFVSNDSFCSNYTLAGNEASNHLATHGLWPDFGSVYTTAPTAPLYKGSYEGWPQFCSGPEVDGFACSANGGLCPTANASSSSFSQSAYESCVYYNNITQCQVPSSLLTGALAPQLQRYAPGYYSQPPTFVSHEFFKHGSCVGGYLSSNATAYFEQVILTAANVTAPGTPAYNMVHNNRGYSVSRTALEAAFYPTAVPICQSNCYLDSVDFCVGRDEAGYPTELIPCSAGTLSSANCASYNCSSVTIPAYPGQAATAPALAPGVAPAVSGAPAKAPTPGGGAPTLLPADSTPPVGGPISSAAG